MLDPPNRDRPAGRFRLENGLRGERTSWLDVEQLTHALLHLGAEQVERAVEKTPAPLHGVLRRALEVEPLRRHARGGELADALRASLRVLSPGYGPRAAAEEMQGLLEEAATLEEVKAWPAERGVLALPEQAREWLEEEVAEVGSGPATGEVR